MLVSFDPRDDQDANDALDVIISFMGKDAVASRLGMETAPAPEPEPVAADPAPDPAPEATNGIDPDPAPLDPQAGVELDANGTPWIAECHATTKTKTVKGVWKGKRGMDKEVIAQMEADARAKIAGTPQPAQPTAPVVEPEAMPQPSVSVEEVSNLWQQAVTDGKVDAAQYLTIYQELGIVADQLSTNETMRATLKGYIEAQYAAPAPAGLPGLG